MRNVFLIMTSNVIVQFAATNIIFINYDDSLVLIMNFVLIISVISNVFFKFTSFSRTRWSDIVEN